MVFARTAHASQVRKYMGNQHADHHAEVVGFAATVDNTEWIAHERRNARDQQFGLRCWRRNDRICATSFSGSLARV